MEIELLIDAKDMQASNGETFKRLDPVTEEVATIAAAAKTIDVDAAIVSANTAFKSWSKTGPAERRALLLKAADIMDGNVEKFTQCMMTETGSTVAWAGFNVSLSSNALREAASITSQVGGEVIPSNKPAPWRWVSINPRVFVLL